MDLKIPFRILIFLKISCSQFRPRLVTEENRVSSALLQHTSSVNTEKSFSFFFN